MTAGTRLRAVITGLPVVVCFFCCDPVCVSMSTFAPVVNPPREHPPTWWVCCGACDTGRKNEMLGKTKRFPPPQLPPVCSTRLHILERIPSRKIYETIMGQTGVRAEEKNESTHAGYTRTDRLERSNT
jgi:hypothetical protein